MQPLITLLSSGSGCYFAQCRWCRESSPSVEGRDDLRVLAAAKERGWQAVPLESDFFDKAKLTVVCPRCSRLREEVAA